MALFMNNEQHPNVFKSRVKITEPNQKLFQRDYLAEWMEEQQKRMTHYSIFAKP